eukprot:3820317-Prymnesium_polylepis.1
MALPRCHAPPSLTAGVRVTRCRAPRAFLGDGDRSDAPRIGPRGWRLRCAVLPCSAPLIPCVSGASLRA